MSYSEYLKPHIDPVGLIPFLQAKGLTVTDPNQAQSTLENINYFRFKIYLWPFYDEVNSCYEAGSTFEHGVEIYRFDEELRNFLFSIIGRIEIKLRTKVDQVVTAHTGNPFWYLDDALFETNINSVRSGLASQFQQSRIPFALHFKSTYYNKTNPDFKQLPPFWTISELTTFGNIKTFYSSLKKNLFGAPPNNKLDLLAKEFGARNLKNLNNWITLIRDIRNVCAHHNRAWNGNYREPVEITNLFSPHYLPSHPNRIYHFLGLLHVINKSLNLNIAICQFVVDLTNKYPAIKGKLSSAGFPTDWQLDPFWT